MCTCRVQSARGASAGTRGGFRLEMLAASERPSEKGNVCSCEIFDETVTAYNDFKLCSDCIRCIFRALIVYHKTERTNGVLNAPLFQCMQRSIRKHRENMRCFNL